MKLAFFADILTEDFDGAVRTIYQIIRRLPKEGFDTLFFCGTPPGKDFPFRYVEIPSVEVPGNEDYKVAIPALKIFELNSHLNEFAPDVIHISSPSFLGKFALDYANWNKIPAITIYHTHFISYIDYYFRDVKFLVDPVKAFVINRNRSFYNHCHLTLVPSMELKKELEHYGFESEKLKLWRRGIDTALFSPLKKDENLLKNKNIQLPVVLFASRLVWEKNLRTLIDIYHLNEQNKKFQLVIAGDGVAKEELQNEMKNAIFLGKLSHESLSQWYATSDVFLFTSNTETYGNVVVEAMASGLPVVVADSGGPKDLVEQKVNGIKCPFNDAHAFMEAINTILSEDQLKYSLISHGLEFAASLSWNSLVKEYLEYLNELKTAKS